MEPTKGSADISAAASEAPAAAGESPWILGRAVGEKLRGSDLGTDRNEERMCVQPNTEEGMLVTFSPPSLSRIADRKRERKG